MSHLRKVDATLFCVLAALTPNCFASAASPFPAGTSVTVRTVDRIESRQAEIGQSYRCTVDQPILVGGKQIVSKGADCVLRVIEMKQAGALTGKSELTLEVTQIRVGENLVDVTSEPTALASEGKGKSTGIKTGVGAAAGAGLGALFGGKKGAAIGAGAGAGTGVATAALTKGPQIKVAPETVLTFAID